MSTVASPLRDASPPGGLHLATADLVEATRGLAPLLEEHAADHEGRETLAPDVVEALHEHGLFRLLAPACLGGHEAPTATAYEVIEELSRADGSTGWSFMAGAIYVAVAGAFLPDEGAEAVLSDPRVVCAGQAAPLGVAAVAPGGWQVEGSFGFASGGLHAGWYYAGFREERDGKPVMLDNGLPRAIVGVFPLERVERLGNWNVIGLIGTGSIDYRLPPQILPEAYSFSLFEATRRRGHPRLGMGLAGLTCIGHCAFATGVARRALDEVAALAQEKRRLGRATLIEDPLFQSSFAKAEGRLAAARAYSLHAIQMWEQAAVAGSVSPEIRAMARLAATHAVETAADVTALAFRFSGSTGLRNGSALQRCYRDLSAGEQHVFTDHQTYRDAGRLLLGLGPETLLT